MAESQNLSGWRPISTAPKDGMEFIGYWVFAVTDQGPQWEVGAACWLLGRFRFRNPKSGPPTHWMPLPEPPK